MYKDKLQWITIASDQAILMSVCLQSMVDELLLKRNGSKKKTGTKMNKNNWVYMKRDGSSQLISPSATQGDDTDSLSKVSSLFLLYIDKKFYYLFCFRMVKILQIHILRSFLFAIFRKNFRVYHLKQRGSLLKTMLSKGSEMMICSISQRLLT